MSDWFARPVLHVASVEASLRFYVDRLGFTVAWRYEENGRACVAQVDRGSCALIFAEQWPDKVGKGLMFISLNVEPATHEAEVAALDALDCDGDDRSAVDNQLRCVDGLRERTNGETSIQEGIEVAPRSRRSLFRSVGIENGGAAAGLIRPLGLCNLWSGAPRDG